MDGVDELDAAEVKGARAAVVESMHARHPLLGEPFADLEIAEAEGLGSRGDADGVEDMVVMAVGDQEIIGRDLIDVHGFGAGVAGNEGVEEEVFARELNAETGMAVVGEEPGGSRKEKLKIQKPQQRSIRVLFTSRSPSMADFKRVQTKKFRRAAEL